MTTLTLTYKAIQSKAKAFALPKINLPMLYAVTFACLFAMIVLYVVLINNLTGGTYLIKSYTKEMHQLSQAGSELEVDFAKTGFIGNMQSRVRDLNFQKTTQVTYIQIPDNYLAQK